MTNFGRPISGSNTAIVNKSNFLNLGLGCFLHFSINTFTDSEFGTPTYDPNLYNPTALNIDQWMMAIVAMGGKYATLTAKHVDGWCNWPTATTPYNISASSWYSSHGNPDVVGLFVSKCRLYNLQPCIYFAIWDFWYEAQNPDFASNYPAYATFLLSQIQELLSNYGAITALWLDGWQWHFGPNPPYPFANVAQLFDFVHALQPNCLIINNDHLRSFLSTDTIEYEYPVEGPPDVGNIRYSECCQTIQTSTNWFWHTTATGYITASDLYTNYYLLLRSRTSNFLLNCPPDNTGVIPSACVTVMTALGALKS